MGLIINGTKMGKPYINGVKHNAYLNASKVWSEPTEFFQFTVQGNSFGIPIAGVNGGYSSYGAPYDWKINWGDGKIEDAKGKGHEYNEIPHTYTDNVSTHTITIHQKQPGEVGWLKAFGSAINHGTGNLAKIKSIITPITPMMRPMDGQYCFAYMFYNCTGLTTVPSNLLSEPMKFAYCYFQMFYNFTSLVSPPMFPYDKTAGSCCREMFYNCSSLTSVPFLNYNGTTASYCFYIMFSKCTSLTSLPNDFLKLSKPYSSSTGWNSMFNGCTGLTNIGNIDAQWFTNKGVSGISNFFYNCTNIVTPITYADIPTGWK
jgi:hypothetical protein